jgi:hypothetical protein
MPSRYNAWLSKRLVAFEGKDGPRRRFSRNLGGRRGGLDQAGRLRGRLLELVAQGDDQGLGTGGGR